MFSAARDCHRPPPWGYPGTLRPPVLLGGLLDALCGRLAAARAALIDFGLPSALCGSLRSILLDTLAPSGELLGVLWGSRGSECVLLQWKYGGLWTCHHLAFVVASGDLHGLGGAPVLPCATLGSLGRLQGGPPTFLRAPFGCPPGLWGTFWRSLGGSGAPLTDFVDFPLTLRTIEKPNVFVCFRQQEINLGFPHGGFRAC